MADTASRTVISLVGVYDADGGLLGEARYLLGAIAGRHCSLCDITHSAVRRRREWDDWVRTLPVPVEAVHRNERTPEVERATAGREPCLAAILGDDRVVVLLEDEALRRAGSVAGLDRELRSALEDAGLHYRRG